MKASQAAKWCGGRLEGGVDPMLTGARIDSRRVRPGDLFVALPGSRADGHDFAAAAAAAGASAILVSSSRLAGQGLDESAPASRIVVEDCGLALTQIAWRWRAECRARLTAVTGSNGKTTVKEMLASIFRAEAGSEGSADRVYSSPGNLNNRLGMSMSLLDMSADCETAVFEAGMNAAGEIGELGALCRPHMAVVNNAQRAHIGHFDSVESIARAKGELIDSLPADGVAVINADDPHAFLWRDLAGGRRVIGFGFERDADYRGEPTAGGVFLPGGIRAGLQVAGEHNALNALCAAAAASSWKVSDESIRAGLESFEGVAGRLQFKRLSENVTLIDDSYNANPDSMAAALAIMEGRPGKRFAALGDMFELGESSESEHAATVEAAQRAGVLPFVAGEAMRHSGGRHFEDKDSLAASLLEAVAGCQREGERATILVKGSRGMEMETVAQHLEAAFAKAEGGRDG